MGSEGASLAAASAPDWEGWTGTEETNVSLCIEPGTKGLHSQLPRIKAKIELMRYSSRVAALEAYPTTHQEVEVEDEWRANR